MNECTELTVLHTLRCVGTVSLDRLAHTMGAPADEVESVLIDLAVQGFATRTRGQIAGWHPTDRGRAEDARRIAEELATAGVQPSIAAVFEQFLVLNPQVLDICTDWQLRPVGKTRVLNDHEDHRYDDQVLRRLHRVHREARPLCIQLGQSLPRFARYGARLDAAWDRVCAGDIAAVADDLESFHTIWFQLHENLLTTLGREREH